jgi:hypothetical protein
MNYDASGMFKEVAKLASKGWKIVRLWGVMDNGRCTCGKADCATPGKHPSGGAGWQHRATDDEDDISHWFDNVDEPHTRLNVGVRLGPTSGIIDVEFDSPEAEAALKRFGLDLIDTPAYSSGRGVHRIFIHEDWMPDSGVIKVEGIEVRIGGGGTASQSVIPPSWHKTGVQYKWLPGRSPADVNPARLPDAFRDAVMASSRRQRSGAIAQSRKSLRAAERVSEGGRHQFLVGIASKMASRIRQHTPEEREELTQMLLCVNAAMCDPPKGDAEVCKIAADQFAYYLDRAIARRASGKFKFEQYGLIYNAEDRCWEPGQWKLTIVQGEQAEYKLRIPHPDDGRTVTVRLDAEEWLTPRKVAVKVLEATSKVDLTDPNPSRWAKAWCGESIQNDEGGFDNIRGLKSILADEADTEVPSPESNVSTYHASILLSYLDSHHKAEASDEDDRKPNHSGLPKWIQAASGEWCLWLKWHETVSKAWQNAKAGVLGNRQRAALKEAILEAAGEKAISTISKKVNGRQGKWHIFRERHIDALRKLADSV